MRRSLQRKVQLLAIGLISLVVYYGFLLDIAIAAKNSIVNTINANGFSTITIPVKEYNGTAWVDKTVVLDLSGLVDIIATLIIVFGPIAVLILIIY
ncbi:hypothetical protein Pyrde_0011 [Pyrodictium delaneyi]|uniref:Uncharacterized protein n=1 Tax=Pyrodictium delaneyi TaxID=1273541 RepID=A0A0P0N1D2_9CREN|nr:hypothetical protein [Pyrodictium delaneyi]ALL00061.1 hypothetical protein Pyrde_0011 [Pyrodictium delaneyi]OWJ55622.1 hypothetical protein Pdsh_02210 [Pyrodictium delaneyi]